jgi:hypothetical protein
MSIHLSACLRLVLVWLIMVFLYSIIDETCHLLLRLVCIIVGLLLSKSAVQDKVLQQGAIPEALVVEVCCARQSPPMRGRSLRPFMAKVCCTRQGPLMRGNFLRPSVVKVCCKRQSPPTRGSSWGHLWSNFAAWEKVLQQGAVPEALMVKVHYARRSPPTRGRSLRPSRSKSALRD